jgi:hypothetical protein
MRRNAASDNATRDLVGGPQHNLFAGQGVDPDTV